MSKYVAHDIAGQPYDVRDPQPLVAADTCSVSTPLVPVRAASWGAAVMNRTQEFSDLAAFNAMEWGKLGVKLDPIPPERALVKYKQRLFYFGRRELSCRACADDTPPTPGVIRVHEHYMDTWVSDLALRKLKVVEP